MADRTTYIRIDRNILHWRWFKNQNTLSVFLAILIEANIRDNEFLNLKIKRGQLATSLQSLCNSTGLTIQQVRTAISHLKSTGEITIKRYSRFQVITVVNYDKYQDLTGKSTYKQQSDNNQITINQQQSKNVENIENGENGNSRSAPPSPSSTFRPRNGIPKPRDEGTVDDIPEMYRDMFKSYQEYFDYRS